MSGSELRSFLVFVSFHPFPFLAEMIPSVGIGTTVLHHVNSLLTITHSLTVLLNRRDRQSFLRSKKNPSERLRKLDQVSPTCTLEKWWTTTKGNLGLSEAVDGQFVWYVHTYLARAR